MLSILSAIFWLVIYSRSESREVKKVIEGGFLGLKDKLQRM
jgi:hypothetical protein